MNAIFASLWFAASAMAADCFVFSGGAVQLPEGPQQGLEVLVADGTVRAVDADVGDRWKDEPCQPVTLEPGHVLTPGLVQVGGTMGLLEVWGEKATHKADAQDDAPVRAAHDAADSYDPLSAAIPVARREGITSAVITPSGGMIAGQAAWVDLWGSSQAQSVAQRSVAMRAGLAGGSPAEGIRRLREVLADARAFAADARAYDQNRSRSLAAGRMELEALRPVLAGDVPLMLGASRAADIEALIRFAETEGVGLIIVGGAEAWLHAEALAAAGIAVLLHPMNLDPSSFDQLHARRDTPALLAQAGVEVLISNQSSIHAHHLRQLAGIAVRHGMDHAAAVDAITAAPARVFGLEGRGVIEPGARADLVVWTGDPLELTTWASHVFIEGQPVSLDTRQTELFERYRELPGLPLEGLTLPER